MKLPHSTIFLLAMSISGLGGAQQAASTAAAGVSPSGQAAVQQDTPAQQRIARAQLQIRTDPKKVQAYNELAIGFLRRARETADVRYLKDADVALAQGLKLDPNDFQLQKTQVSLMLRRHEFAKARESATVLNHRIPDDVMTYGYIAEADIALGNYAEAETNAQWMMNLRPNNTPALMVGASLRTLYGDSHGAIDFLNRAFSQTSPAEVEELAWIANQIALIQIDSGQSDAAAKTLQEAKQAFPRYPYTIENLARVSMAQNRAKDAVQLLMEAKSFDTDPHVLYELARAQEAAGQEREAHATYAEFERLASEPGRSTNASRLDLILMYAESPAAAPNALKLARQEIAARQDVWTLDAYAWALYANAKYPDADAAVQKAIAVGIQSAQIFNHAGHIADKLNHSVDATRYFKLSLQSNPDSEYAADALKAVSLTLPANKHERKTSQVVPVPTSPEATQEHKFLTASDQPNRDTMSVGIGARADALVFPPVPEPLLMPQPTGTSRIIHSAQATVARNPNDAGG